MKAYQKLRILSYEHRDNFQEIVKQRQESVSAVHTGIFIHPFDNKKEILLPEKVELFYLILQKTSLLKDQMSENSRRIDKLMNDLPAIAKDNIFYHLLINEIQATNDIEGVQSTRREIREAITAIIEKSKEKVRFKSLVNQYMNFEKSTFSEIKKVEDFREIYDSLLEDEIEPEDQLMKDELFRSKPVWVVDNRSSKKVHQGVDGQEAVIMALTELADFMNRHDIPTFEKVFISHFLFENIHPFYDGNGRTGRFILCSYLARKLDYLSAIGVSTTILENKKKYASAFQEVSNPKNYGEVTFFVLDLFDILLKSQKKIFKSLAEAKLRLETSIQYFDHLVKDKDEILVLYALSQQELFDISNIVTDIELTKVLGMSRQKVDKIITHLREKGFLTQTKRKPLMHRISQEIVQDLKNSIS